MSASDDAEAIYRACKGFGTDEKTLIHILGHRDWAQIQSIAQWYQHNRKEDMIARLQKETSGDFGKALVNGCKHPCVYDAELIREASKGAGTREGVIIEVMIRRPNADMQYLAQTFRGLYNKDLVAEMRSEFSGNAEYLFTLLCQVNAIHRCFHGDVRRDEVTLIQLLVGRSDAHLRNVFQAYAQRYQRRIEDIIKKELNGDLQRGLSALVQCVQNAPLYVAELLESAMAVIVRNRGPFMEHVKLAYIHRYGKSLRKRIEGETSGDYRKLLLAYINDDK
ncbi:hypothetical protein BDF19DRAFT_435639 [Syncephalis fuscata]|nr:hypothetical protein BDF19DRAFT_435639 [Syncephalis fuscata]